MPTYAVEAIDTVTLDPAGALADLDLMSPFVWNDNGTIRALIRGVPYPLKPGDPTGIIVAATSKDGLVFAVEDRPAIGPGTTPDAPDAGGCEDPTVVIGDHGQYLIFYTGVDAARQQGSMIVAEGPSLDRLEKRAVLLQAPPDEGNIKEATVASAADGTLRLFYEYAKDNASRIGVASAPALGEKWTAMADPFGVREDSWDDWHLSTGPIVQLPGADPVMFYNGATADARWRIGWVSFDAGYTRVTNRGLEPLILPPPPTHRDSTDIAFAASTLIVDDRIHLYYSLEDRILRRAIIRYYA